MAGLAGCIFGSKSPPPRRSDVFSEVAVNGDLVRVDLVRDPMVETRQEDGGLLSLAPLAPVGVARAAKGKGGGGGRGATGRAGGGYRSAPKTSKGRAKLYGGGYTDDWRENHEDEIERREDAVVTAVGFRYFGSDSTFESRKPGPGRVSWDEEVPNPQSAVTFSAPDDGWYRVGAHLESSDRSRDYGWESIDFEIDEQGGEFEKDEVWKVSPRL